MIATSSQNFILKPGSNLKKPNPQQTTNPSLNPNRQHCSPSPSLTNPKSHFFQNPHHSISPPPMSLFLSRPKHRSLTNPSLLIQLFSTSSTTPPPNDHFTPENTSNSPSSAPPPQQQQPSFSSYFGDVKASLKNPQNPQPQNHQNRPNLPPLRKPTSIYSSISRPQSKIASLEEIKKNLSHFRHRSSVPPPTDFNNTPSSPPPSQQSSSQQQMSFQDLYKRNLSAKWAGGVGSNESAPIGSNVNKPISGKLFEGIRERLGQVRSNNNNNVSPNTHRRGWGATSFSGLKLNPGNENESVKSTVFSGTEGLPRPVLGQGMKEDVNVKREMSMEFVKNYSYAELGDKLRSLRPEVKKGEKVGFSLEELNDRLRKLREWEEKENESRIGGVPYRDLRDSLAKLKLSDDEKNKKNSGECRFLLLLCC